MNTLGWNDDDTLLGVLDEALQETAEVPAEFVAAGKAVFTWQSIDDELAALTFDSLVDSAPAATRTERAAIRELTFASRRITIHVQVSGTSLHGQVVPPQPGEIEVRTNDRPLRVVEIDEQGWFTIGTVPTGSFRLHCRTHGGAVALTDWLTV